MLGLLMSEQNQARFDPRLRAVVVSRRPLVYDVGPDVAVDRPAHVRAGSGLAHAAGRLVVVQDDASFFALLSPTGAVEALTLPHEVEGRRQFEAARGNKYQKLDLEACVTLPDGRVLALGSGSRDVRTRVVLAGFDEAGNAVSVVLRDVPALYAALANERRFSGSQINLEGAAALPALGVLRLFQRGNGAACDGFTPVSASCDLALDALLQHLDDASAPVPALRDVAQWRLGEVDGTALGFTDACAAADRIFFLAAAEASPNTYDDGSVSGVVLGVTDGLAAVTGARLARLEQADGAPFRSKAEGLALDPRDPTRALVVLDDDDATRPAELCELRLDGPWWEAR
jgi:hypothetical protein